MSEMSQFSHVKIMGERNSGTSFLSELLRLNFQVELLPNASPPSVEQKALIGRIPKPRQRPGMITERIQDDNHLREMPWNAGWKHACLTDRVFDTYEMPEKTLFLCILRHPALNAVTERDPLIMDARLWICGGPMNLEAAARLAARR